MECYETALLTVTWQRILERFNATSISLQKVETDLISVVKLYNSLTSFVKQMREDSQLGETEQQAGRFVEEPCSLQ